eukprot:8136600-Heterocapsa_arctica.AAC.1
MLVAGVERHQQRLPGVGLLEQRHVREHGFDRLQCCTGESAEQEQAGLRVFPVQLHAHGVQLCALAVLA